MTDVIWQQQNGSGPVVAVANHGGHELRADVAELMILSEADRLREEDPFTDDWARATGCPRITATRSRFEVDLNRPPENAVYRTPDQCWGLNVWRSLPSDELVERSMAQYRAYYDNLREVLTAVEREHGRFCVYDIHSYNHMRDGPSGAPADPEGNPQVNIGTGTMDRARWARLVDRFLTDLAAFDFPGGRLDVRENVKFYGLQLPRWVHETFPETGCVLAIEFKKFFMDEWTGEPDRELLDAIGAAIRSTVAGVTEELGRA